MTKYPNDFLGFKCASDVLAATGPIFNGTKEITEAMSVIQEIRGLTLNAPMRYDLLDVCSGNALVPIIAAHLLPVRTATAIDVKRRAGRYERVDRFRYLEASFQEYVVDTPTILTAVHSCASLAYDVAEFFLHYQDIAMAVIMPCCVGRISQDALGRYATATKRLNKYELFALQIAQGVELYGHDVTVKRDNHVLSPANILIVMRRKEVKDAQVS